MNFNYFIGPACLLFGALLALFVKDKARDVAKNEFTEQITAALAVFKVELLTDLSNDFVRHSECVLREDFHKQLLENVVTRLDVHSKRIQLLEAARGIKGE